MNGSLLCLILSSAPSLQGPGMLRGAPLHYDAPATGGAVEAVKRRLESGELELSFDPQDGYLRGLLDALNIPVSSQMLVFSKTSFQSNQITPSTPRAIYFGDAAYVGSVPSGRVIEVTSIDPAHGPVFYTVEQSREEPPRLTRRDSECLQCHASPSTRDWPGNLVRSVHPDRNGRPILRSGTTNVTQETPFEKRWGGWYVTGTHGAARHRGNAIADTETGMVSSEAGANVEDLAPLIDTELYLSPHSDIVALMVFEHQTEMHNRIARAGYEGRLALHRQVESNRIFGDPPGTFRDVTRRILQGQAEKLLDYMLFEAEIPIPAPIRGTSSFAEEFQARGKRDPKGRSLRDLDLNQRLFRHPCSYLIHSPALDGLPEELLEVFYRELGQRLSDDPQGHETSKLSRDDRRALREILRATKTGLPVHWGL